MPKALLVGGPKNGTVLDIVSSIDDYIKIDHIDHEEKLYEYRQQIFVFTVGDYAYSKEPYDQAWIIWTHGDIPPAREVMAMIEKAAIPPTYGGDLVTEPPIQQDHSQPLQQ